MLDAPLQHVSAEHFQKEPAASRTQLVLHKMLSLFGDLKSSYGTEVVKHKKKIFKKEVRRNTCRLIKQPQTSELSPKQVVEQQLRAHRSVQRRWEPLHHG